MLDKKLNQHLDIEVELMSHDHEMMGLNPADRHFSLLLLFLYLSVMRPYADL